MQMEWQNSEDPNQTIQEQSELGLHVLLRPNCPNIYTFCII